MAHPESSSTATLDNEDWLLDESEEVALDQTAKREAKLTAVRGEQHKAVDELMNDPKKRAEQFEEGSNPRAPQAQVPRTPGESENKSKQDLRNDPRMKQLHKKVDTEADQREGIFHRGEKVAHLHDHSGDALGKRVRVDAKHASVRQNRAAQEELGEHEHRHTLQKTSNLRRVQTTSSAKVNRMLQLGHVPHREEDAMHKAGDRYTHESYHRNYKAPVKAVEQHLNANGENGAELVRDAGLNGKMQELHDALHRTVGFEDQKTGRRRTAVGPRPSVN